MKKVRTILKTRLKVLGKDHLRELILLIQTGLHSNSVNLTQFLKKWIHLERGCIKRLFNDSIELDVFEKLKMAHAYMEIESYYILEWLNGDFQKQLHAYFDVLKGVPKERFSEKTSLVFRLKVIQSYFRLKRKLEFQPSLNFNSNLKVIRAELNSSALKEE